MPSTNFAIELDFNFNFNTGLFAGGSNDAAGGTLALLFFLFFGTVGAGDADVDARALTGAGCAVFCFFGGGPPPDELGRGGGDIAWPDLSERDGV